MKYLITGGAGFIGSHLCEKLINESHHVIVLDNMSTGSYENIRHLRNNKYFELVIGSVLSKNRVRDLVSQCDRVYHLAAAVGVKLIMEEPVETIRTNIIGTENLLHNCSVYGKKVMIVSSSEVYGKIMSITNHNGLLKENSDCLVGPTNVRRWAYSATKAIDEFLALAYYEEKQLPVVIIRLFNTVGPRQTGRYGMVIPTFVQKAMLGEPIPVFGDGTQKRCFTYVDDAIDAMTRLMDNKKAEGQVINIGNGEEITIKALADLIKKKTRSKSIINYIPYNKVYGKGFEDMQRRKPDISKLQSLIEYKPTIGIEEILNRVIQFIKSE